MAARRQQQQRDDPPVFAGLTAEMIAAVTKLMSNLDLVYGAQKLRVTAHCANTIGLPGTLASRNQPNHPTNSPDGIRAAIYEGLSYGSGDSVIGINPVDNSYNSVARLLEMTYDIIRTWEIPTQNCVLAHVTTQMRCLRRARRWVSSSSRLPAASAETSSSASQWACSTRPMHWRSSTASPLDRTSCISRPARARRSQPTRTMAGTS